MSTPLDLAELFGDIDVYLFDQLLRGRIAPGATVLDAGCGGGRNLRYLLRAGYDVYASDPDPRRIAAVRALAAELAPGLASAGAGSSLADRHEMAAADGRFRVESLEEGTFAAGSMDVVVCNAVLHFAEGSAHFEAMLAGAWRPLRSGGVFFSRLASSIGLEASLEPRGDGRFLLPDGTERFLVDEARLMRAAKELGGRLLDPIKTTNVQGLRCMTTWVLRKA